MKDRRRVMWLLGAGLLVALGAKNVIEARNEPKVATAESAQTPRPPGEQCKGFNGEAHSFAGRVKLMVRNPDSFEHVSTKWGPFEGGVAAVAMTYRATNGFGAVDTGIATGEVRASDCAAKVLTI